MARCDNTVPKEVPAAGIDVLLRKQGIVNVQILVEKCPRLAVAKKGRQTGRSIKSIQSFLLFEVLEL